MRAAYPCSVTQIEIMPSSLSIFKVANLTSHERKYEYRTAYAASHIVDRRVVEQLACSDVVQAPPAHCLFAIKMNSSVRPALI